MFLPDLLSRGLNEHSLLIITLWVKQSNTKWWIDCAQIFFLKSFLVEFYSYHLKGFEIKNESSFELKITMIASKCFL